MACSNLSVKMVPQMFNRIHIGQMFDSKNQSLLKSEFRIPVILHPWNVLYYRTTVDMEFHQLLATFICMYLNCIAIVKGIDYHCLSVSESGTCEECYTGRYGAYCDNMCQHCDTGGCHKTTGVCLQCQAGYFSTNCSLTCPPQCRESYGDRVFCDRTTGKCLEGCKLTWWGDKCEHKCGKQCTDSQCFFYDGSCASGCKDGLSGTHCDKTCSVGCLHGTCSQQTGICLHGCKPGFYGSSCDRNCTDKCLDRDCSTKFDGDTPTCIRGCVPGWKPPLCDRPCPPNCLSCTEAGDRICDGCPHGWWGQTCELACSQNCLKCQQKSGNCTTCLQGFTYDGRSQCTSVINATVTDVPNQRQESHTLTVTSTIACLVVIGVLIGISVRFRGRILSSCIKYAEHENALDNEEPESSKTDLLAQDPNPKEDV